MIKFHRAMSHLSSGKRAPLTMLFLAAAAFTMWIALSDDIPEPSFSRQEATVSHSQKTAADESELSRADADAEPWCYQ